MFRTMSRTLACAAATASILVLSPSPASAQQAEAGQAKAHSTELAEIVVTARRREENLQDVPVAVTAFSAQTLQQVGATDLSDIAEFTPSVTLEPSRATNSTLTAFIRGVGQQDPLAGFEPGVALYVDDVYIARPQGALLDIFDIQRIEVLRGPQGTLYGRNAIGGAIKYVTRPLGDQFQLHVKGTVGTYDQRDLVATVAAPISDKVRIGASVASLYHAGYGRNLTTHKGNYDKDVLAGRLSLELLPTDDLTIRFAGDYTRDTSDPVAGYRPYPAAYSGYPVLHNLRDTLAGAAINASTAGIHGNNEVTSKGLSAHVDWHASDTATFKSITAYRKDYTQSVIDFDSLPVDDFDAPVIYDNHQFSQEFQLLLNFGRLNGVVGAYYLDAHAANDFDVVLGELGRLYYGAPLTAYTGGKVDTKAWSLFSDFTYDLTEAASVSAGLRYTNDKRSADIFRANYLGEGSPFFGNTSAVFLAATSDYQASRTFRDLSPRLVFSYKFNPDVNGYVSFSQGFKAGSFDPRGSNFATPDVVKGYKPETLNSYEAGLKSTLFDGKARANIALFYSDYKDMQIPGSLPIDTNGDGINDSFVGAVTNAGKATIQGIEFEGEARLTDALTLQASLSALDPKIDRWIVNGVNVASQRRIQNTPKFMSMLGLNYAFDVSSGSMNLNANWSHKSAIVQFETPVPEIDQGPYDLVNASVAWTSQDGRWTAGLYGKNLTDTSYRTAGYNFPTLGLENNITVFYGPPRTVSFTVDYRIN